MSVGSFFGTTAETQELHIVRELRSRYYKANYQKLKAAVLEYAKNINLVVSNVDDAHKEILLQNRKYHIIVSLVQVNPIETSVDFKVEFYGLFGLHRPRKLVISFYDYLNRNLQFKGVGLHP